MSDAPHTRDGLIETNETHQLISSDKVEGTSVFNGNGDKLGSVYTLMIDKRSGKVSYAVMSFGGFLGLGERYHPLPWETLRYEPTMGGYVANLTTDQLEQAPSYAREEQPWERPGYGRSVSDYYGMPYAGI